MRVFYYTLTNPGNRGLNEDAFSANKNEDGTFMFTVCDGLGGTNKGEVASKICAETFARASKRYDFAHRGADFLAACFRKSQRNVLLEQEKQDIGSNMKTTCVALCCDGDSLTWGHVGDSRLYAFKDSKIITRTTDHSVPQMLVASGKIKEKDIRFHPSRNKLLRAIGDEWDREQFEISKSYPINDFDAFLLCTDGFWELVTEKQMEKSLKKAESPRGWLKLMEPVIADRSDIKNKDNFTALAVMFK